MHKWIKLKFWQHNLMTSLIHQGHEFKVYTVRGKYHMHRVVALMAWPFNDIIDMSRCWGRISTTWHLSHYGKMVECKYPNKDLERHRLMGFRGMKLQGSLQVRDNWLISSSLGSVRQKAATPRPSPVNVMLLYGISEKAAVQMMNPDLISQTGRRVPNHLREDKTTIVKTQTYQFETMGNIKLHGPGTIHEFSVTNQILAILPVRLGHG